MDMSSPFRERKRGVRMQPRGLRALTENVLSGFSHSPFNMSPYLTAGSHTGTQIAVFITGQGGDRDALPC